MEMCLRDGTKILIDLEDFERLGSYTWRILIVNNTPYAVRSSGFGAKDNIYMHREVLNEMGRKHIVHLNKNTLDNRRANLGYRKKEVKKKRGF